MVRIKKEKKRDWELVILLARIPRLRERAAVLWGGRKSPGIDSPFISHKRGRGARQRVNGRPTYLPFALCPSTAMSLAKVTLVTTTSTRRTRGRESGASGQAIVIAGGASEGRAPQHWHSVREGPLLICSMGRGNPATAVEASTIITPPRQPGPARRGGRGTGPVPWLGSRAANTDDDGTTTTGRVVLSVVATRWSESGPPAKGGQTR